MKVPEAGRGGCKNASGGVSRNPVERAVTEPVTAGQQDAPRPNKQRLAAIFGDTLFPDLTGDELDDPAERAGDTTAWLNENRPPHHDR